MGRTMQTQKRKAPAKEEPAVEPAAKRKAPPSEKELLPVSHASHGKVRAAAMLSGMSITPAAPASSAPTPLHPAPQAPGEVFVFGDGDCGQLGLGEDVTERLRPAPLSVGGSKASRVVGGLGRRPRGWTPRRHF